LTKGRRGVNPEVVGGCDPTPKFWAEGLWGRIGGREISYDVQEVHVCSKVMTFEEK